ncbi:MAG: tetratricopeptide repeat protein [Gemmatimonadales bacterium]
MKAPHRFALPAVSLAAALIVIAAPAARAQRGQAPGPDTPRILVTAFRGDATGGVKMADEIRNRIASDFSPRTLYPTPKKDIDATLIQSGYKPDSALSANDSKELAKLVRADEIIDGTVTKTPAGYRVVSRFFLPRDVALSQPLVTVESNNLGDVAKQVVHEYDEARKQLASNRECENDIRDRKIDAAIAAARKGIQAYPKATLARLCLATAYQAWKTTADSTKPWADSVIAVTKEVSAIDPHSKIAYTLQYDAYKAKGDSANALEALVGMMNSDPTNSTLRESVIAELVTSGKPEIAIPSAKQLVAENPGDPQYARTYWLVLRSAHNYKESVPAGMAYVALDSAAADSNYYFRQIADLRADSAYAKAAEFAAEGIARFPKSGTLYLQKAQNERSAGQLPAAKASLQRALQLDPKAPGANLLLAQMLADLNQPDSAIAAVRADVASDASNKERDAVYLLGLGQQSYKAGVAAKSDSAYKVGLDYLQASDSVSPSDNAKFLIGVSSYQLLTSTATALQKSKSCTDARTASNYLMLVNTNMPAGGKVNPEAAKQILGVMGQYQTFVDGSVKKYCK